MAAQLVEFLRKDNLAIAHVAPWLQNSTVETDEQTFPIFAARQEQISHALKSLSVVGLQEVGAVFASPREYALYREDVARTAAQMKLRLQSYHGATDLAQLGQRMNASTPAVLLFIGGTPELVQFTQGLDKQARQRYVVALADVNLQTVQQMGGAKSMPVIATQAVPMVTAGLPVVRRYREVLARLFDEPPVALSLAGFIAARYTYEVLAEIDGSLTRSAVLGAFQQAQCRRRGRLPRRLQCEGPQRDLCDAEHADGGRPRRRLSPRAAPACYAGSRMQNGTLLAAVDLGSNSFRLEIGRYEHGQIHRTEYLKETVRQGNGLDEARNLTPEAMQRGWDCLARFGERLAGFRKAQVRAVATQTLREARNREAFLAKAHQVLGFPIDVISGREEARLIYQGVAHLLPQSDERRLVADIGGRSTELILGRQFEAKVVESYRVGSVAWSMRYFPNGEFTQEAFDRAAVAAKAVLDEALTAYGPEPMGCGVRLFGDDRRGGRHPRPRGLGGRPHHP